EILLAARVSPTGKFSNLSVTACPVMQGQVQKPLTDHPQIDTREGVTVDVHAELTHWVKTA
ncbi:hypothetical protein, partial [Burkholderia gladioli]